MKIHKLECNTQVIVQLTCIKKDIFDLIITLVDDFNVTIDCQQLIIKHEKELNELRQVYHNYPMIKWIHLNKYYSDLINTT